MKKIYIDPLMSNFEKLEKDIQLLGGDFLGIVHKINQASSTNLTYELFRDGKELGIVKYFENADSNSMSLSLSSYNNLTFRRKNFPRENFEFEKGVLTVKSETFNLLGSSEFSKRVRIVADTLFDDFVYGGVNLEFNQEVRNLRKSRLESKIKNLKK